MNQMLDTTTVTVRSPSFEDSQNIFSSKKRVGNNWLSLLGESAVRGVKTATDGFNGSFIH